MDPDQQAAITLSFMHALTPVITRYHMQRLVEERENKPAGVEWWDIERQIATENAKLTIEFAVHLTAQFALLNAALNPTQTQDVSEGQNPVAPGEQGAGKPPAGVQPPAASVLAGTYPVSDLRRDRH